VNTFDDLFNNIKKLRMGKGWKQYHVAQALDMSVPAYCQIENGKIDVNLSRLEQLADLYGTSVVALFTGVEMESKEPLGLESVLRNRELQIAELKKIINHLKKELGT
jgi:transcriptional regulator with XRE-family HTH domain